MNEKVMNISEYLRSAVAAQVNKVIDFKDGNYAIISKQEMKAGSVSEKIFSKIKGKENNSKEINVIIVAKVLRTNFKGQAKTNDDIDELTGIYYVPATLNDRGKLGFTKNKMPWIPREFLEPMCEKLLSIGREDEFDEFLSSGRGRIHNMNCWKDYIELVEALYKNVVGVDLYGDEIGDIQLEKEMYILKDNTVVATREIMNLYNNIISDYEGSELYENFIDLNFKGQLNLIHNGVEEMHKHSGQMGGDYPLSPSQRESINHFNNMSDGDILAVNGPPGTGKTTLLQSIVANMYVESALKNNKPPRIVAASTNNQAVTNIIESFGNISVKGHSNLEERWVEGVKSFAVYFPSQKKKKDAETKGYHYTDNQGNNFFEDVECSKNIKASKEKMIEKCSEFFGEKLQNVEQCRNKIHRRLQDLQNVSEEILAVFAEMDNFKKNTEYSDHGLVEFIVRQSKKKSELIADIKRFEDRMEEWKQHFKKFPMFIYGYLKFLSFVRRKIEKKNKSFTRIEEYFIDKAMTIKEISDEYNNRIKAKEIELNKVNELIRESRALRDRSAEAFSKVMGFGIEVLEDEEDKTKLTLDRINGELDKTLRYIKFWLAIHYYECRWIEEKNRLSENQKGKTYRNIMEMRYDLLSMLTPCFVMTFFQLPKNFKAYGGEDKKNHAMYNHIDLLIVDEAGQVSPEIAACSFSLAKKALVVGDIHQIEPIWGIGSSVDKSIAIQEEVIKDKHQFEELQKLGINASESSVMRVAAKSCKYMKNGDRGLFLSEHRRCYDEIISYCNELVYKGNLEPMRGMGTEDEGFKLKHIPQMGVKQVTTSQSSRSGSSRYNKNEAEVIVEWINRNFESIKGAYPDEDLKNLIGVITPFKAQTNCIKKEMKSNLKNELKENVSVGTVHTFQGAERRIIILSTVYGNSDGCSFLNRNRSMLNVAVSRAKDSFLVFGDVECLGKGDSSPSGKMRKYIEDNKVR